MVEPGSNVTDVLLRALITEHATFDEAKQLG
jgi:hypothetical protein